MKQGEVGIVSAQPGVAEVAALNAAQADWTALKTAAASGQLRLEPGVAEQCAVASETLREQLRDRRLDVQGIGRLRGFGSLDSGMQLAAKFERKIALAPGSAEDVLTQHVELLTDIAATYRAAATAFAAHDQAAADALRAQG